MIKGVGYGEGGPVKAERFALLRGLQHVFGALPRI
jgi:hypothetical protein